MKLWTLLLSLFLCLPWLLLLLLPCESSESENAVKCFFSGKCFFFIWKFFDVPTILKPREQKRKESSRIRSHTSQVLVTPLPG
ncbi:hypothetical protein ACR8HA_22420, partial [Salmonella enterica subsp. enterica serovar Paratyphi A]